MIGGSPLSQPSQPQQRRTVRLTTKRDASLLDWHFKLPSEEELADPYECFPDDMWAPYYQASKESSLLPPRKRAIPALMTEDVKRSACEDCTLPYQLLMQRLGKCHPIDESLTPEGRGE
jgi:hypothetical protein